MKLIAVLFLLAAVACSPDEATDEGITPTHQAEDTVIRFMDARMDGSGASGYLTARAREHYDRELSLYGRGYRGYEILSAHAADAGSYQFVVDSTAARGDEVRTHQETLAVGSGQTIHGQSAPYLIRAVMRQ
jgi:hypothetical protein